MSERFVADGYERARSASEATIRTQVTTEYAARYERASFWERLWLLGEIEREIERRMRVKAPPDALYIRGAP